MKKYVNPIPAGGAPLHNNRLNTELNAELWESIQSLLSGFTAQGAGENGLVVSGCVVTANAANFDITAGIVFLDGEFMRLPAYTNQTFTKYIAAKAVSYESKVFADGGTKNLIEVKEAELVGAAPGVGQYITISSVPDILSHRWDGMNGYKNTTVSPINSWSAFGGSLTLKRQGRLHTLSGAMSPNAATDIIFLTTLPAGYSLPSDPIATKGKSPDGLGALNGANCDVYFANGVGFVMTATDGEVKPAGAGTDYYLFSFTWISTT